MTTLRRKGCTEANESLSYFVWRSFDIFKGVPWGQGELTPSLPRGKNPEIGNLSIFRILTSNLVSKVFY
jgi:hypothetical protein